MTRSRVKGRTTSEALLCGLRARGFDFRVANGQLLVSPVSRLTPIQRDALRMARTEIMAILAFEEATPPATGATLKAWYHAIENPYPRRKDLP